MNLRTETQGYLFHQHRYTVETWHQMINETLERYVALHEDPAVMLGCMVKPCQITSIQIQLGFFRLKVMPVLLLQESFVELRRNALLNSVSVVDDTAAVPPEPPAKKVPGQK